MVRFNGPEYDPVFDKERLTKQIGRVYQCMIDGEWRTLREIAESTGDPESSVSAQLRHLRKPKFGAYHVFRKPRGDRGNGLYEYRLEARDRNLEPQKELLSEEILRDLTDSFFGNEQKKVLA